VIEIGKWGGRPPAKKSKAEKKTKKGKERVGRGKRGAHRDSLIFTKKTTFGGVKHRGRNHTKKLNKKEQNQGRFFGPVCVEGKKKRGSRCRKKQDGKGES